MQHSIYVVTIVQWCGSWTRFAARWDLYRSGQIRSTGLELQYPGFVVQSIPIVLTALLLDNRTGWRRDAEVRYLVCYSWYISVSELIQIPLYSLGVSTPIHKYSPPRGL